jgi:single-strand DNA-binding protein
MNTFELIGNLIEIFPTQTFSKGFKKREFVIEIGDKYPKKIIFQLMQEKCNVIDSFSIGDEIKVSFNISGRDWTDRTGTTKYFNSLEAWRITGTGNKASTAEADPEFDSIFDDPKPLAKPKAEVSIDFSDDDLPF